VCASYSVLQYQISVSAFEYIQAQLILTLRMQRSSYVTNIYIHSSYTSDPRIVRTPESFATYFFHRSFSLTPSPLSPPHPISHPSSPSPTP
jgi:hypothetical protein